LWGLTRLDRIRSAQITDVRQWLTARLDELPQSSDSTPFSALASRLRPHADGWEPIVVIVDVGELAGGDRDVLTELIELCQPGSGPAVVLLGDHPDAHERIECADVAHATWVSTSVTFTPATLSVEAEGDLEVLYKHASNGNEAEQAEGQPVVLADLPATPQPPTQNGNGTQPPADEFSTYDLLVRVLGEVIVEGGETHLTEAEVELLALLASLRPDGAINLDRIATLLARDEWRTPNPATIKARISTLRTKLGVGRDGQPLLPTATTGQNSAGRYMLSELVVTDVDLLEKCYQRSLDLPSGEAVATLQAGLQMVRGKPYIARSGYTWAVDEQAAVRAQQAIVDLAARLVELLGDAGDTRGVLRVTSQAAHAIDDPLTQLPYRRVEASVAAATGDLSIAASVLAHRRELQAYLDANDPSSTSIQPTTPCSPRSRRGPLHDAQGLVPQRSVVLARR
jgi:hypothetical protein